MDSSNPKGPLPADIQNAIQNASQATAKKPEPAKKANELGQQEFLLLLMNQLKNQDPLNPLDSQAFAAQLAQFSSLEQLIGINKKLEGGAGNGIGSMASYLGQEIVTNQVEARVSGGAGPNVLLDIPVGSGEARVDFVDPAGQIVGSKQLSGLRSGKQVVQLSELDVPDGSYELRAVAVERSGQFAQLTPKITGTVEGFVLQPAPALIVGGEEVPLEDVQEVYGAPRRNGA